MTAEARTGSRIDRIPVVGRIKRSVERTIQERADWRNRDQRWGTEYFRWANPYNRESDYAARVNALTDELMGRSARPSWNAASIQAEERVSMERFCELGVAIPKAGIAKEDLAAMGFSFPPPGLEDRMSSDRVWITRYPDGWELRPTNPDRLAPTGSDWATVYDETGRERITIFWRHSGRGESYKMRTEIPVSSEK